MYENASFNVRGRFRGIVDKPSPMAFHESEFNKTCLCAGLNSYPRGFKCVDLLECQVSTSNSYALDLSKVFLGKAG